MINFMELGTTTFEEGIAGGMDPGAAAQAVTLPAATVGTYVVHYQSDDTTGGTNTLTFTCAGNDVYRTGSKVES